MPWRHDMLPPAIPSGVATAIPTATTKARLTVGVMWTDGNVQPHPPVRRALQMVVDRLSASARRCCGRVDALQSTTRRGRSWCVLWPPGAFSSVPSLGLVANPSSASLASPLSISLIVPDGGEEVLEAVNASGELLLPLSRWILDETCGRDAKPLTMRETTPRFTVMRQCVCSLLDGALMTKR